MYHKTQPSESDYSLHILIILQKNSRKAHITLRESLCLSLCRDPHVLLDADAELDLNFVVVVDLDPLHQPGNDHRVRGHVLERIFVLLLGLDLIGGTQLFHRAGVQPCLLPVRRQ